MSDSSSYLWHVRYQDSLGAWSDYSSETLFSTKPVATAASNSPVYVGGTIQLYGGPSGMSYSWTGPNGFSCFLQNPTIPNATSAMAGNYILTVTSSNGCTDDAAVSVTLRGGEPPYNTVGWETYSVNKVSVLLRWIALIAALIVCTSLLMLRQRRV